MNIKKFKHQPFQFTFMLLTITTCSCTPNRTLCSFIDEMPDNFVHFLTSRSTRCKDKCWAKKKRNADIKCTNGPLSKLIIINSYRYIWSVCFASKVERNFDWVHKVPKNTHLVTHSFALLLICDIGSIFRLAKRWRGWKDAFRHQTIINSSVNFYWRNLLAAVASVHIKILMRVINNDEAQYSGSGNPCPAGSRRS